MNLDASPTVCTRTFPSFLLNDALQTITSEWLYFSRKDVRILILTPSTISSSSGTAKLGLRLLTLSAIGRNTQAHASLFMPGSKMSRSVICRFSLSDNHRSSSAIVQLVCTSLPRIPALETVLLLIWELAKICTNSVDAAARFCSRVRRRYMSTRALQHLVSLVV